MQKGGTVYIMSSPNRTTLYTGVTSNLYKRVWEHKNKIHSNSFSARYNCTILVYFASYPHIEEAIAEEKRIKGINRQTKEALINAINKNWLDLWETIQNW